MSERAVPNFLIIGAPKSGTTSLYKWLMANPDIFMPENKEPSLFIDHAGHTDWDHYCSLFAGTSHFACRGEASAGYLAAPEAPERILDALPDVRMIVLLREPARRAFSCWAWMVMMGYEWLSTFAEALEAEDARIRDPGFKLRAPAYFMDYLYRFGGLYADQLQRYFDVFPRDRVRVFLFDELVAAPERIYAETCAFLQVRPGAGLAFRAENVSTIPRSIAMQCRLRRLNAFASRHRWPLSGWLASMSDDLMKRNLERGTRPVLDEETHALMREYYREPNARLADLIGKDLSSWA